MTTTAPSAGVPGGYCRRLGGIPTREACDCPDRYNPDFCAAGVPDHQPAEPTTLYCQVELICKRAAVPITPLAIANVVDESDGTLESAVVRLLLRIPIPEGSSIAR